MFFFFKLITKTIFLSIITTERKKIHLTVDIDRLHIKFLRICLCDGDLDFVEGSESPRFPFMGACAEIPKKRIYIVCILYVYI